VEVASRSGGRDVEEARVGEEPRPGSVRLWLRRARRLARAVRELAVRYRSRYTHLHALLARHVRPATDGSAHWADAQQVGNGRKTGLLIAAGASVTYRLRIEPSAVFRVFVAAGPGWQASEPLRCRVEARSLSDGMSARAARAVGAGLTLACGWREICLSLARVGAGEIDLELAVESAPGSAPSTPETIWGDPALFVDEGPRWRAWLRALWKLATVLVGGDAMTGLRRFIDLAERLSPEPPFRGLPAQECDRLRARARALRIRPMITVLVAGDDPRADLLRSLQSLRAQSYDNWEAWVCRPGTTPSPLPLSDPRIKGSPPADSGLAASLNGAMAASRGDFLAVLNPGDELSADALVRMVEALEAEPATDVLYSDEAGAEEFGAKPSPLPNPDWSPELLLSYPYVGRPCLLRRELIERLGGWREECLAAEEYDLILRSAAAGARIQHVRRRLYRRAPRSEDGADRFAASAALAARRVALESHLRVAGPRAEVIEVPPPVHLRVRCLLPDRPLVSIIIPTRDRLPLLRRCLDSIEQRTDYAPYEIVIVDNESAAPTTLAFLSRCPHRVIRFPGPFNFAAINNAAARAARGEYLVFLNNDTQVRSREWLSAMLEWARQPEVGCVGAKLLLPDGRLQHVGVVLRDGAPEHLLHHQRAGHGNRWTETELVRNFASVTAACMMVKRSAFEEAGGFDEAFPVNYNDVDFCLRLRRRGLRHVYTPFATLYHDESASRAPGATEAEYRRLTSLYGELLSNDPYWPPLDASRVEADV
jgi:GT2 family glycosyltransferase